MNSSQFYNKCLEILEKYLKLTNDRIRGWMLLQFFDKYFYGNNGGAELTTVNQQQTDISFWLLRDNKPRRELLDLFLKQTYNKTEFIFNQSSSPNKIIETVIEKSKLEFKPLCFIAIKCNRLDIFKLILKSEARNATAETRYKNVDRISHEFFEVLSCSCELGYGVHNIHILKSYIDAFIEFYNKLVVGGEDEFIGEFEEDVITHGHNKTLRMLYILYRYRQKSAWEDSERHIMFVQDGWKYLVNTRFHYLSIQQIDILLDYNELYTTSVIKTFYPDYDKSKRPLIQFPIEENTTTLTDILSIKSRVQAVLGLIKDRYMRIITITAPSFLTRSNLPKDLIIQQIGQYIIPYQQEGWIEFIHQSSSLLLLKKGDNEKGNRKGE